MYWNVLISVAGDIISGPENQHDNSVLHNPPPPYADAGERRSAQDLNYYESLHLYSNSTGGRALYSRSSQLSDVTRPGDGAIYANVASPRREPKAGHAEYANCAFEIEK